MFLAFQDMCCCEPFFSTYIATVQDVGLGSHLLFDAVLQTSQVEVGICGKETENNTSVTDRLWVKLELHMGSRQTGQMGQTSKETKAVERTYKLNQIKHKNMI
jgi:hypothetical protein